MSDQETEFSVEQRILVIMRKTLSSVIRDVTPEPGQRHPLTEGTVADIRGCLQLITSREKELAEAAGQDISAKPYYTDEFKSTTTVAIGDLAASGKKADS